jgi:hypothetical protein
MPASLRLKESFDLRSKLLMLGRIEASFILLSLTWSFPRLILVGSFFFIDGLNHRLTHPPDGIGQELKVCLEVILYSCLTQTFCPSVYQFPDGKPLVSVLPRKKLLQEINNIIIVNTIGAFLYTDSEKHCLLFCDQCLEQCHFFLNCSFHTFFA